MNFSQFALCTTVHFRLPKNPHMVSPKNKEHFIPIMQIYALFSSLQGLFKPPPRRIWGYCFYTPLGNSFGR
jgi:hypothetical protein